MAETLARLPDGDRWMTTPEVARRCGVAVVTVANWRSQFHGPKYFKISPKVVLYRESDVEAWIQSRAMGGDQ